MKTTNTNKATAARVSAYAATINFDRCPLSILDYLLSLTDNNLQNIFTQTISYYDANLYKPILNNCAMLASTIIVSNFPIIVNFPRGYR